MDIFEKTEKEMAAEPSLSLILMIIRHSDSIDVMYALVLSVEIFNNL